MRTDKNYGEVILVRTDDERSGADAPEFTVPETGGIHPRLSLEKAVSAVDRSQREKLIEGYDLKSFAKIFEDEEMMATVESFLENRMNVIQTAEKLYMHRNTLTYRLNKIMETTGLDLHNFDDAVTFEILHILYLHR